jgi:subtilisin family serine protease
MTPKPESYDPMDDFYHGTHVAGIIGAKGNNGIGISGVMWDVKLMPVKIYNANSIRTESCTSIFVSDEVAGIEYAVDNGAKIINASFHGEGNCISEYNAISFANTHGVLFVAAAGNGGDDRIGDNNDLTPHYPSSYNLPNIISVAASDQNDQRASFSNFGPTSVDVAAPGVYILSTIPQNMYMDKDFNFGTSMAAPHVSGLAGLLMTYTEYVQLGYTIYQFRAMIETYVDQKSQFADYVTTGGRINAYRSISSMLKPDGMLATSTKPHEVILAWNRRSTGAGELIIERMRVGVDTTFQQLVRISGGDTTYTDMTVTGGNTYKYRIRAYKNFGSLSYLPSAQREVYSLYSNEAPVTTPLTEPPANRESGGCSIGARQNTPTAIADLAVMLMPLLIMAIMRRRR